MSSLPTSSLPSTPKLSGSAPPGALSLLSLPLELLSIIGHHVAPEGGRAVGALRCSSKSLLGVFNSILFSRIHVTRDEEHSDALLAALAWGAGGFREHVRGVRWDVTMDPCATYAFVVATLPNLRHLDLRGVKAPENDADGLLVQDPIPIDIVSVLPKMIHLESLHVEKLEIIERRGIHVWAPTITDLHLDDCLGASRPFFGQNRLRSATLFLPQKEAKLIQSFRALAFLEGALPTVTSVILRWSKITARDHNYDPLFELDPTTFPLQKFHLVGTPSLFLSSPPLGHATGIFIELLQYLGRSDIEELSLPLRPVFVYDLSWAALQMPSLRRLVLVCQSSTEGLKDVFTQETYTPLIRFLASFPALTSLHLRGWLDLSGVETLGRLSPAERARDHVCVVGLLAFLRESHVIELRFSYSEGYLAESDQVPVECVFDRWGDGEWQGRVATIF